MGERRSQHWYAGADRNGYIHRSWMRRGLPDDAFDGRPHIAIADTGVRPRARAIATWATSPGALPNGIWEAGGVPLHMPVMGLGETQVRPTAMLWRNLAAMSAEELFRANPIDGVVLLGGCDKTIPSLLMAAASVDLPALVVPGGPMLTGTFQGEAMGCGTSVWRPERGGPRRDARRRDVHRSESAMVRSAGHCNTMGTASTMGFMAEALGMTIPGTAGIPAPDSRLQGAGPGERPTDRRDGRGGAAAERGHDRRRLPERDRDAGGRRWVHQCRRPPAGHRRPAGRPARPRRLRPDRGGRAAPRGPAAGGPLPHGGPVPRRRPGGGPARGPGPAGSEPRSA